MDESYAIYVAAAGGVDSIVGGAIIEVRSPGLFPPRFCSVAFVQIGAAVLPASSPHLRIVQLLELTVVINHIQLQNLRH